MRLLLRVITIAWCCCTGPVVPAQHVPFRLGQPYTGKETVSVRLAFHRQFTQMRTVAGDLEAQLGDRDPELRQWLQTIRKNIEFLQIQWMEWLNNPRNRYPVPVEFDPYYRSLKWQNQALKSFHERNDPESIRGNIHDIALDIETKADNCRHSIDGLGREIKVQVRTVRDATEIKGFQVWYCPKGLYHLERAHFQFSRHSSPTTEILAPGNYYFWLEKEKVESEPVPKRIGGKGEQKWEVDLATP